MKRLLSLLLSAAFACGLCANITLAKTNRTPDDVYCIDDGETYRQWYREEYGGDTEVWGDFWVVRVDRPGDQRLIVVNYWGDDADIIVPEGVTGLPTGNFFDNKTTKSITLPDGVADLGYETFYYTDIEKIVIPPSIKDITDVFYGCSELSEVVLSEGLEEIGENAFGGCTSLENIQLPDGLKTIRDGAFHRSGLEKIIIPESVTILEDAFTRCDHLEKIIITSPNTELKKMSRGGAPNATIYAPKGSKAESAAKKAGIPFKAIALNKTTLSLSKGKTYQLKFNSGSDATWKSNNSKVVSVSKTGKLTAKANGTATITATLYGKKYTCKVTVSAKTYTVKRGDSLWSIAAKQLGNGRRYTEIMKLNGMKSTKIVAGQKLKLPEK